MRSHLSLPLLIVGGGLTLNACSTSTLRTDVLAGQPIPPTLAQALVGKMFTGTSDMNSAFPRDISEAAVQISFTRNESGGLAGCFVYHPGHLAHEAASGAEHRFINFGKCTQVGDLALLVNGSLGFSVPARFVGTDTKAFYQVRFNPADQSLIGSGLTSFGDSTRVALYARDPQKTPGIASN